MWRDEAQEILDMARRELAASQDENKILHGELTAMEHHFKHYRETTARELEAIPKLQVCDRTPMRNLLCPCVSLTGLC